MFLIFFFDDGGSNTKGIVEKYINQDGFMCNYLSSNGYILNFLYLMYVIN